ncbi:MAG: class II fumarate hydratase, partial [Clostridia bacterium]|nr:class II fumarate hydratase [Clostridia bacterium]
QVMANDTAVSLAASQGNFELNVFMPVTIYNLLQSVALLSGAIRSFNDNCAVGIRANKKKMQSYLNNSLMTITALSPLIGYENAARVVHKAHDEGITLREACTALGYLTEADFDKNFHPERMV